MNIKKFGFLGLSLVLLASAGFATTISSESFKIDQYLINAGGTTTGAGTLETTCSIGDATIVSMSSASYESSAGFQSTLSTIATLPVSSNVIIDNVRFDGKKVVNNDYIQANALMTATVRARGTGIDTGNSRVVVDGTATTFADLTGASNYTAEILTYQLNLTDGTHIISIEAQDTVGNPNSYRVTLQVDTGALKATSVDIYPNPYNPNTGLARIAYNLNTNGETSVYIFNAIGELIYRSDYASGTEGGSTGYNEVTWNGTDFAGNVLANDVYFLRLVSGGKVKAKCKIAILK